MALQQIITLPNGTSGNYLRVGDVVEMHRRIRRAHAHITLFLNADQAAAYPDYPLAVVGVLHLQDAKFDTYLSKTALATYGGDPVKALYAAVKAEATATPSDCIQAVNGIQVKGLDTAVDV